VEKHHGSQTSGRIAASSAGGIGRQAKISGILGEAGPDRALQSAGFPARDTGHLIDAAKAEIKVMEQAIDLLQWPGTEGA
jgi:hypothetical protein